MNEDRITRQKHRETVDRRTDILFLYDRCRCSNTLFHDWLVRRPMSSISLTCLTQILVHTYQKGKVQKKNQMAKSLQIISFILWLIRSFLSIFIHLGFRLIYGNQKFRLPPITNQWLLQPAIVIAKRIRQRQVDSFERQNQNQLENAFSR